MHAPKDTLLSAQNRPCFWHGTIGTYIVFTHSFSWSYWSAGRPLYITGAWFSRRHAERCKAMQSDLFTVHLLREREGCNYSC